MQKEQQTLESEVQTIKDKISVLDEERSLLLKRLKIIVRVQPDEVKKWLQSREEVLYYPMS